MFDVGEFGIVYKAHYFQGLNNEPKVVAIKTPKGNGMSCDFSFTCIAHNLSSDISYIHMTCTHSARQHNHFTLICS